MTLASPILDQGNSRIGDKGCSLVAVVGHLAQRSQRGGVEALVDIALQVQQVIPQRVHAHACDALSETAVDQSRGRRRRRQRRSVVRKSPGRRRIPRVLYSRGVVCCYAPEQVLAEQLALARIADIE